MNKLQNRKRLIPMAAALLVVAGLAGCADDASGLGGGTTAHDAGVGLRGRRERSDQGQVHFEA